MKSINNFISICESLANKSIVRCAQHGAVLVHRGKVISSAYNTYSNIKIFEGCKYFQKHW